MPWELFIPNIGYRLIDMTFPRHLEVLMDFYGSERTYEVQTKFALVVPTILSSWDLDA
jgi:hypothetical protein